MVRSGSAAWIAFIASMGLAVAAGDDSVPLATAKAEPLTVGAASPSFTSTDDAGQPWNSADHFGNKVVVMYFYPGDDLTECSFCGLSRCSAIANSLQ